MVRRKIGEGLIHFFGVWGSAPSLCFGASFAVVFCPFQLSFWWCAFVSFDFLALVCKVHFLRSRTNLSTIMNVLTNSITFFVTIVLTCFTSHFRGNKKKTEATAKAQGSPF